MLTIVCPQCQHPLKLNKVKPGKFAPTCSSCKTRFQLLIGEKDGKLAYRAKLLPGAPAVSKTPAKKQNPAAKSDSSQPAPKRNTPTEKPASESAAAADQTRSLDATGVVDQGKTQLDETFVREPIQASTTKSDSSASSSHLDETFDTPPPGSHSDPLEATEASRHSSQSRSSPNRKSKNTRMDSQTAAGGATRIEAGSATPQRARAPEIGGHMGPYRLLKLLGQGGMGAVYLARQTTLDRNVALKVIRTKLSDRPSMLARFTREAYAAAQLVHPNVVQIYDMGDEKGNCFFSMELVEGASLSDVITGEKKLDPEQAASYILHAARGLECAHNAGMVHRDIKPANLLVDHSGVVKIADLGLVKVPDQEEIEDQDEVAEMSALSASKDLTRFGSAVGTPYYMAPEQAKNAVLVDHRADIYSLGCTLYVLLTGKKPFEGSSFQEVVSKHESAPLVVPSRLVERVPESLSAIVERMMAKTPDQRYQSMRQVIEDLEKFLGVSSTAAFTPDEDDAKALDQNIAMFNGVKLTRMRGLLPLALTAGSVLVAVLLFFFDWRWATGFLLMPAAAFTSYFVWAGMATHSNLFSKSRQLLACSGILGWIKLILAGFLFLATAFLLGLLLPWLVCGAVGAGLGIGYYLAIDRTIQQKREMPIQRTEQLLRKMRLKGMDEVTVQMFVAKYSGKHWEEFFEALFGYEAKRRVRDEIAKSDIGKTRPKFWAWRDRINDHLDAKLEPFITEKERAHLQKVEQAGLQAEGLDAAEARKQAAQMADALVDHGDSIRVQQLQERLAELDPEAQRLKQRLKVKAMLAEARSGKYKREKTRAELLTPTLNRWIGPFPRFLAGSLLIVGCILWARQSQFLEDIKATAAEAGDVVNAVGVENATNEAQQKLNQLGQTLNRETDPLKIPLIGPMFFFNFNALVAGLILVFSSVISGWKMTFWAIPSAIVTLWGAALGIPDVESVEIIHSLSAVIGVGLFMGGVVFGRMED